jgi:DNA invertase Pin-like site-specific DNA recombinase
MLERQRDGIEAAEKESKFKGRAPTARRQEPKIRELAPEGVKQGEIARRLGISIRSVHRIPARHLNRNPARPPIGAHKRRRETARRARATPAPLVGSDPITDIAASMKRIANFWP